jgi:hypothetical protein
LLATYLARTTQRTVTTETVRVALRAAGSVLQMPHLAFQTQSRSAAWLREKRLRVEGSLAGAGTPPPVTPRVEAALRQAGPLAGATLLPLLPHADVYLQDEGQCTFPPPLTRGVGSQRPAWTALGRRAGGQ